MSKGASNELMESLMRCNEQLFQLAAEQGKKTNQILMETNLEDVSEAMATGMKEPGALIQHQIDWWQSQLKLFQNTMLKQAGQEVSPVVEPGRGDRRFRYDEWQTQPWYDFIKQSYLLASENMMGSIEELDLDEEQKERLRFFTRQSINAMAPSNFIASNPELMRITLESNGENLTKGLKLLMEDVKRSANTLNVRMTDESVFELGKDIANTPGKVVYQSRLFELLQYKPTTEKVAKRPVFIVPPFINKYYILDLRPDNSMVKYLVDQGHTVYMMSWANPDESFKDVDFEDYVVSGVIEALEAVEQVSGEKEVNAAAYCIGATLLLTTMAYMSSKRMKQRIKSATLFTAPIDFSQAGEIGVFVNDKMISAIEEMNAENGILDGRQLAVTFALLRENSLYWNYFVDGYLKGKTPVAFDLLHWNCDSTNVAGPTHSTMLRKFYLENCLYKGEGYEVCGTKIDLSKIKVPTYFVSTSEDHIALWQGTYEGVKKVGGDKTFVLGESGHIAGIINPPGGKYGHYVNANLEQSPEEWLEDAERKDGTWWAHWMEWMGKLNGGKEVDARQLDEKLTDAPGDYVQVRLNPTFEPEPESEA